MIARRRLGRRPWLEARRSASRQRETNARTHRASPRSIVTSARVGPTSTGAAAAKAVSGSARGALYAGRRGARSPRPPGELLGSRGASALGAREEGALRAARGRLGGRGGSFLSRCTPCVLGLHAGIAFAAATFLRLNRLWAVAGSRVSFVPLFALISFTEIQAAHRIRTGVWAALSVHEVATRGKELLTDWCIGSVVVGGSVAVLLGLFAYAASAALARSPSGGGARRARHDPARATRSSSTVFGIPAVSTTGPSSPTSTSSSMRTPMPRHSGATWSSAGEM